MKSNLKENNRGRKMDFKTMRRAKKLYGSKRADGGTMTYRDVAAELGIDVKNAYNYVNYDEAKVAA